MPRHVWVWVGIAFGLAIMAVMFPMQASRAMRYSHSASVGVQAIISPSATVSFEPFF
jgi:hypothetical protein